MLHRHTRISRGRCAILGIQGIGGGAFLFPAFGGCDAVFLALEVLFVRFGWVWGKCGWPFGAGVPAVGGVAGPFGAVSCCD